MTLMADEPAAVVVPQKECCLPDTSSAEKIIAEADAATAEQEEKLAEAVERVEETLAVDNGSTMVGESIAEGEGKDATVPAVDEAVTVDCVAPPAFSEESYRVKDLKESEKKALFDLKLKIEEVIQNKTFFDSGKPAAKEKKETQASTTELSSEATLADAKPTEATCEASVAPNVAENGIVETEKPVEETLPYKDVRDVNSEAKPEAVRAEHEVNPAASKEAENAEEAPKGGPASNVPEVATTVPSESVTNELNVESKSSPEVSNEEIDPLCLDDLSLWGIPLLHTKGDERTDVILLKFLRARDFKVNDAMAMLKETLLWRKSFGADNLLNEEIVTEFNSVAYMHGSDKEGHPVCYNHYGIFQDTELYQKTFYDEAQFKNFLRWRIQVLEKGIQKLDFRPNGVNSIVQITDFKDSPGFVKLRSITRTALAVLQDNYPELVAKQIFINVPWYFGALYALFGKMITPRSKSKVMIARPDKVTETLFKYISPENVPIRYGGFSRLNDTEFEGAEAPVTESNIRAGEKHVIEINVEKAGSTVVWDVSVIGWEVVYGEEFVPSGGGYTMIIQKAKKVSAAEEPMRNSFKATEPGKVVLTIDNTTRRKRLAISRYTIKKEAVSCC